MKNIKKFIFLSLSFIIILTMVSGCNSQKNIDFAPEINQDSIMEESGNVGFSVMDSHDMENEESMDDGDDSGNSSILEPTKVIVRFFINMETIEFDKSISALEDLISKNQAYVENSSTSLGNYYGTNSYRTAEYVIRVPKSNIDSFITETGSLGKVTNKEESKEDVTMHYRDTESRLNVLNIKEERILELLKKAEKMEDIIALENSLSDLIYQKESLTGVLKSLDNKVDFSTVTIYLEEVQKISHQNDMKTGFGQRILNAISDSLYRFRLSSEDLLIGLIYAFPTLIILVLIGFIGYKVSKFIPKKKHKKNNIENK